MEVEKPKITNNKQFECLITCMEQNPDIAKGYFSFGSSKMEYNSAWNGFADKINSLGPPKRDGSGWQKVWTDFKGKIKKKMGNDKKEIAATGGGSCRLATYSSLEESVISVLSFDKIFPRTTKGGFGLSSVVSRPNIASSSTSNVNLSAPGPSLLDATMSDPEVHVENEPSIGHVLVSSAIEDREDLASSTPRKKNHPKKPQSQERYRLLEIQTNSIQEIEKYVKESSRFARKSFELKKKKFEIWQQHQLDKKRIAKENIALKLRQIEYKERRLALEENRQ